MTEGSPGSLNVEWSFPEQSVISQRSARLSQSGMSTASELAQQYQHRLSQSQSTAESSFRSPMGQSLGDSQDSVSVVDPTQPKIRLCRKDVIPTLAFSPHSREQPSLCMLYLRGRCTKNERCHQVHAQLPAIEVAREEARQKSLSCCYVHTGRQWDFPYEWGSYRLFLYQTQTEVLATFTNRTRGLEEVLRGIDPAVGVATIEPRFLCQNEANGKVCRFAEDCKFIHLCRQWRSSIEAGSPRSLESADVWSAQLATPALPGSIDASSIVGGIQYSAFPPPQQPPVQFYPAGQSAVPFQDYSPPVYVANQQQGIVAFVPVVPASPQFLPTFLYP